MACLLVAPPILIPLVQGPSPADSLARDQVVGPLGVRLDSQLTRLAEHGFSGTVLVVRDRQIVLLKGYGLADVDRGIPNTAASRFEMNSMTKMFTGVAVLQLVAEGRLRLKDAVERHLGAFPSAKQGATCNNLRQRWRRTLNQAVPATVFGEPRTVVPSRHNVDFQGNEGRIGLEGEAESPGGNRRESAMSHLVHIDDKGELSPHHGDRGQHPRDACLAHGCSRVLVEENLQGPSVGLVTIFNLVSRKSQGAWAAVDQFAYVDVNPAHDQPAMKFAETVAVNRGLNVRLFSNTTEAAAWLLRETARGPGA